MLATKFIHFINQQIQTIGFANHQDEAQKIFEHITGLKINQALFSNKEFDEIEANKIIAQRKSGIPLAYILGYQYFFGYKFLVNKHVLIPRCDSEILVHNAIINCKGGERVLDLGTGSGCLGISIAKNIELSKLVLVDIDNNALEISAKNANYLQVKADFLQQDMLNIKNNVEIIENCDILISNPPYIDKKTFNNLERQVKDYEPQKALTDGNNGLLFYKAIINSILLCQNKPRLILLEIGFNQATNVLKIAGLLNNYSSNIIDDMGGRNRVLILKKHD